CWGWCVGFMRREGWVVEEAFTRRPYRCPRRPSAPATECHVSAEHPRLEYLHDPEWLPSGRETSSWGRTGERAPAPGPSLDPRAGPLRELAAMRPSATRG